MNRSRRNPPWTLARRAALAALALATACSTVPTSPGGVAANVGGTWHYLAASAASPTVDGTLALTAGSGSGFTGSLDATEASALGQRLPLTGLVSGRASDATSIEFDIVIGSARLRHHVATVRADSITGTWIETGDSGAGASGSFRAGRIS